MTEVSGDWITAPGTVAVLDMLEGGGHMARFVGGCVRDALADRMVKDIDIATDARPEAVMGLAEAAGLQAIPTGIDHGTVTVIADGTPYEITTFRRDVETDGRHAVVAFSGRLDEDAKRRDLTFNALYADRQGRVEDPVGTGIADLSAGLVRFVGDPGERIREDYLRILRYFRFLAWFGDPTAGPDADTLAAISDNLAGLDTLAAERIGHEMRRLLGAPGPVAALGAMAQIGALAQVLPGADITAVGPLVHLETESGVAPNWLRRLVALGGVDVQDRLRLSKQETQTVDRTREAVGSTMGDAALGYRLGADMAWDVALIRAALAANPLPAGTLSAIQSGTDATFPVAAKDLMPAFEGPALGAQLRALEDRWIASDFTLDRQALLDD